MLPVHSADQPGRQLVELRLKRVTVTTTDPQGKQTTAVGLRARSSSYEELPDVATLYLTGVGVELQVGSDTESRVSSGTNLLNRVSLGAAP